jgi:hypothetical protein
VINGDTNCDGDADEDDVIAILWHLADLDGPPRPASVCAPLGGGVPGTSGADADCSGGVDAHDALRVLLAQVELDFEPPPADCPAVGEPVEESLAGGVLATFRVIDEEFKVWVTNEAAVQQLFALDAGTSQANIPVGQLAPGAGQADHNAPWSWHYQPESIEMGEAAIEGCDGLPAYVEENLDDFLMVGYCPWSAELIDLQDFT